MKMNCVVNWLGCAGLTAGLLLASGCATGVRNPSGSGVVELRPDEKGAVVGTGVESTDLVRVTDKMARGILECPRIASAPSAPLIVLEPVSNETRFPFNKNIFLDRIRGQLIGKAQGKAMFVAGEPPAGVQKDFVLTGKLASISSATGAGISDYVLYMFQLIDVRTRVVVWEGQDEIKKQGLSDAVYR
jgi:penicillin-binding protein activator